MKEHKHPHEPPANAWCPPGWLLFCTRSPQSPFPFLCAVDDGLYTLAQSRFWACLGTWVSFVLSGSCGYQPSIPGGEKVLGIRVEEILLLETLSIPSCPPTHHCYGYFIALTPLCWASCVLVCPALISLRYVLPKLDHPLLGLEHSG